MDDSEPLFEDKNKSIGEAIYEVYSKCYTQIKIVFEIFIFIVLILSFFTKKESPPPILKKEVEKEKHQISNSSGKVEEQEEPNLDINIALCVIAKGENKYIREFVEFYKKMKVDKIFLYDNNDPDGEKFDEVISDYINNGYVQVNDFRGIERAQHRAYKDCYDNNYKLFDWFLYFDVDEFIYLKDFNDIKSFASHKRFKDCERIHFNWVMYTDNNLLYYDDRPVLERFTEKEPNARKSKSGGAQEIKSMIRGKNPKVNVHCIHVIDRTLKVCDGFGNRKQVVDLRTLRSDYEYYYLRHYYSKSTEEFIEKIMKTDAVHAQSQGTQLFKIKRYFTYNVVTKAKLDLIENRTGLDLSGYRYRAKS